jgi:isoamylase
MSDEEWETQHARCLGVFLAGGQLAEADRYGMASFDDDFLMLFNAHHEGIAFRLPPGGESWEGLLDTFSEDGFARGGPHAPASDYTLHGRTFALLTRRRPRE